MCIPSGGVNSSLDSMLGVLYLVIHVSVLFIILINIGVEAGWRALVKLMRMLATELQNSTFVKAVFAQEHKIQGDY